MSTGVTEMFKVSWRSPWVLVPAALFALPVLVLGLGTLPLVLATGGVWLAVTLLLPVVAIGDDGLVLQCVNRLAWHEVVAVRYSKVLGLPHFFVTRHKGFRWWVPLYVVGKRPLLEALAARAPIGNPLQAIAAGASFEGRPRP